jgi:predicted amidohydrolase YtcJ
MELVTRKLPKPPPEEDEKAVLLGVKRSLELGWTQVQDAGGPYSEVELYQKLYAQGKIKLRIYKAVGRGPDEDAKRLLREGPVIGAHDGRFTLRSIKIGLDGALGSRGAALSAPYADKPDTKGFLIHSEAELLPLFEEALRRGIQIQTHAIGDSANRVALGHYLKAFAAVPPEQRKVKDPRWRVEHAQVVHPSDIPLFAKLGVIPSMQPSHAIGDLHFAPARLGKERLAGAYAWRDFLRSGSVIAGGSDAPVEKGDPRIEFYAAVARKDLTGFSGRGWHPEQAVSRPEALKMFTLWAAYAAFEEDKRGSIVPGKWADLTVFSEDILKIPEARIPKIRCLMTVVGGEVVYRADGGP